MPELPEVETTLRGLKMHLLDAVVSSVVLRRSTLRLPIPEQLKHALLKQKMTDIKRRAKYLLFITEAGTMIIHLGMSGRLQVLPEMQPAGKHDHCDFVFSCGKVLRYTDPRRFGCVLFTATDPLQHRLLNKLGPEPLLSHFSACYLYRLTRHKKSAIKNVIMDSHNVVGIGNIYATEALFASGVLPDRPANTLTLDECRIMVRKIKKVLRSAIKQGGTTLKDFYGADGQKGYFSVALLAYGRAGKPCMCCGALLMLMNISGRSSVYCNACQH